jgi:hypothetical protein
LYCTGGTVALQYPGTVPGMVLDTRDDVLKFPDFSGLG